MFKTYKLTLIAASIAAAGLNVTTVQMQNQTSFGGQNN